MPSGAPQDSTTSDPAMNTNVACSSADQNLASVRRTRKRVRRAAYGEQKEVIR